KAFIRSTCWGPLLSNRKQRLARRLRYLTLPGRDLLEVRLLVEEGTIQGLADLVLCEREVFDFYWIAQSLSLLPFQAKAEVPELALGTVEDLICGGHLSRSFP